MCRWEGGRSDTWWGSREDTAALGPSIYFISIANAPICPQSKHNESQNGGWEIEKNKNKHQRNPGRFRTYTLRIPRHVNTWDKNTTSLITSRFFFKEKKNPMLLYKLCLWLYRRFENTHIEDRKWNQMVQFDLSGPNVRFSWTNTPTIKSWWVPYKESSTAHTHAHHLLLPVFSFQLF